jgi:hypothetical protein
VAFHTRHMNEWIENKLSVHACSYIDKDVNTRAVCSKYVTEHKQHQNSFSLLVKSYLFWFSPPFCNFKYTSVWNISTCLNEALQRECRKAVYPNTSTWIIAMSTSNCKNRLFISFSLLIPQTGQEWRRSPNYSYAKKYTLLLLLLLTLLLLLLVVVAVVAAVLKRYR